MQTQQASITRGHILQAQSQISPGHILQTQQVPVSHFSRENLSSSWNILFSYHISRGAD